jgi:hypothetical protein
MVYGLWLRVYKLRRDGAGCKVRTVPGTGSGDQGARVTD